VPPSLQSTRSTLTLPLSQSKRWLEGDYLAWDPIPGLDDDERDEEEESDDDEGADEELEEEGTGTDDELRTSKMPRRK